MTTTPETRTPEQAITEAMNYVDDLLAASQPAAPYCGDEAYAEMIARALRAYGLLGGDPTEETPSGECRGYCEDGSMACGKPVGEYECTRAWRHDGVCVACGIDEHDLTGALRATDGATAEAHECSGLAAIAEIESLRRALDTQTQRAEFWERRAKGSSYTDEQLIAEETAGGGINDDGGSKA